MIEHQTQMGQTFTSGVIRTYGDWGNEIDRLDGADLKEDEVLVVRWPDGTVETILVHLDCHTVEVPDHGHTNTAYVRRAYAEINYRGMRARAPLVGLAARRVT